MVVSIAMDEDTTYKAKLAEQAERYEGARHTVLYACSLGAPAALTRVMSRFQR